MRTVNSKNVLLIFTILFFIFLFACISNIFFIIEGVDNTLTNSQTNNESPIPHLATAVQDAMPHLKQAISAAIPSLQQALSATENQLDSSASTSTVPEEVSASTEEEISTSSEAEAPAQIAAPESQIARTIPFIPPQGKTKITSTGQ